MNRFVSIVMGCVIAVAVYVAADYHQGQELRKRALSQCQTTVKKELHPVESMRVFGDHITEVNSVFVAISGHYRATFPSDGETSTTSRGSYRCLAKYKDLGVFPLYYPVTSTTVVFAHEDGEHEPETNSSTPSSWPFYLPLLSKP